MKLLRKNLSIIWIIIWGKLNDNGSCLEETFTAGTRDREIWTHKLIFSTSDIQEIGKN